MDYLRESIYFSSCNEVPIYSLANESSNVIVSDYVHNLANGIYKEFESLILHYGESVVKNLMPMVVSCLETLDRVYSEKHNIEVEFELLKEDSGQLMKQYEREKFQRKKAEEDLFKCEDNYSEASKKHEEEMQKFKSNQKMIEIRLKNSVDQISRFEKREKENQLEYNKLLSRYHELLRYHKDYIDKSKPHHNELHKSIQNDKLEPSDDIDMKSVDIDRSIYLNELAPSISNIINISNISNSQIASHKDWDYSCSESGEDNNSNSNTEEICGNALLLDDDLAGMSHEIENIIKENNDLIATKNALNIVKDDLITKLDEANSEIEILQHENNSLNTMKTSLKLRINNLEIENKSLKQEIILLQNRTDNDGEENIPISQRKRFTRLEMTRVLMERNQYKESLLELEEYVKWMKMLKDRKDKKLSIWERFSRLFTKNNPSSNEKNIGEINPTDIPEKINNLKNEKTELTSNCLALKDPERQQINGWSLSRNLTFSSTSDLPIPIYCRPLIESQSGLKLRSLAEIICAVTVNVYENFNIKYNTFVGSSIFYNSESILNSNNLEVRENLDREYNSVDKINQELNKNSEITTRETCESYTWICTSSDNQSQIIIVDANKPADYLDAFIIHNSPVQCLGSVPGANQKDYIQKSIEVSSQFIITEQSDTISQQPNDIFPNFKMKIVDCLQINPSDTTLLSDEATNKNVNLPQNDNSASSNMEIFAPSSSEPTVWIGCQNGDLFVHPASSNRSLCLHHVRLSDSITNIIYQNSKVFISLANGSVVVFNRYISSENKNLIGQWQMSKYHLLEPENFNHSIRCLESVTLTNKVWIGYKNLIIVIDDVSLTLMKCFEAHPRADYAVRQMCCSGNGMWISLRLDTTLRLFHIHNYQHLQDLNVEPHINKLIEPSLLGLSLLRITCLSTSCNRLWIGTNKGMVISAPFIKDFKKENEVDTAIDVSDTQMTLDNASLLTCIPYINHENLQLSYHGHRDSVKFFVTVRCNVQNFKDNKLSNIQTHHKLQDSSTKYRYLIMSGGEGYKDFRLNEAISSVNAKSTYQKSTYKSEEIIKNSSHLIVWQLSKYDL